MELMTSRRPRGTGSVERIDGAFIPRLPRRYGRVRLDACPTHAEAQGVLAAALDELSRDPSIELRSDLHSDLQVVEPERTVEWLGQLYLDAREEAGYAAVRGQRSGWRSYVTDSELGAMSFDQVGARDVRAWLSSLRKRDGSGLAAQTLRNALTLISTAFRFACDKGWLEDNPALA